MFNTVNVQVVRNYMNFITCQKSWSWQFSKQFGLDRLPLNRFQHF